jgi:hypothetical protein
VHATRGRASTQMAPVMELLHGDAERGREFSRLENGRSRELEWSACLDPTFDLVKATVATKPMEVFQDGRIVRSPRRWFAGGLRIRARIYVVLHALDQDGSPKMTLACRPPKVNLARTSRLDCWKEDGAEVQLSAI